MMSEQMILPTEYHVSDLIQYLNCPKAFELGKRFPKKGTIVMVLGSIAHSFIENWHKGKFAPRDIEEVSSAFLNRVGKELAGVGSEAWSKKNSTRLLEIPTMLWKYMVANGFARKKDGAMVPKTGTNPEVRAIEENFVFEFAGLKFAGTIDQIRRKENGEIILVDIKTGENAPSPVMLDLSYQFSVYAYAMGAGTFKSGNSWDYPAEIWLYQIRDFVPLSRGPKKGENRGPAIYKTYRTPEQLEEVMGDIVLICTQIMLQIFPRHPSWACTMCRYQEMCLQFTDDESAMDMMDGLGDDGNLW